MIRILNQILVTLSASPAISLVAKGTVVLALGLIGAWLARGRRAAVRHALLASTFSVLLALPIVSVLATPIPIVVPVAKGDSSILPVFDYIPVPSSGELATERLSPAAAKSGRVLPPLSGMLLCGWFISAAFFVILVIKGLLQIRSLRRYGLPWRHGQAVADALVTGVHRQVEVLLHESLPGPMTCGVLRPLIVLPADAQSWDEQDLERALVHELEHVRRYDWVIHCLARVACAAYWFHPLVWTAWWQLTLEAERSCDDAVLRSSEATAYADQLVGLARRRSGARKSPVLAMANRSDLSSRVRAVLDTRQRRGRAGAIIVATACTVATAVVLTMSPLRMVAAPQSVNTSPAEPKSGQTAQAVPPVPANVPPRSPAVQTGGPIPPGTPQQQPAAPLITERLTFDAASLKPVTPSARPGIISVTGGPGSKDPGRYHNPYKTVKSFLMDAYGIQDYQVVGPGWLDTESFDIEATMPLDTTKEQFKEMLQNLLLDRFKLAFHRETRDLPSYSLLVAKGGPKMKDSSETQAATDDHPQRPQTSEDGFPVLPPAMVSRPGILILKRPDRARLIITQQTTGEIASYLAGLVGRPVRDATKLFAKYDSTLTFETEGTRLAYVPLGPVSTPEGEVPADLSVAIQEQLGLRLQAGKGPVEVMVVDDMEKAPTEN